MTSAAHAQLAGLSPEAIDWPQRPLLDPRTARSAAVLVLFGRLDNIPAEAEDGPVARDLDVLLQRRAATLGSHAGQISFPGGRAEEPDASAAATALREATEETGLDPSGVEVLGELPQLSVLASNHLVTPVLAWWRRPSQVAAVDHAETQEVFRAPVADLLAPENRGSFEREWQGHRIRGPVFDLGGGLVVWGFTAIVLDGLFDALGWTEPWDADRLLTPPF